MTSSHQRLGPRGLAVAAIMNLVWGLNIIAVKMGVEVTGPFTAAALRLAVVLVVCAPALRIVPGRMRILLLLGVLNGAGFLIAINLSLMLSDNVSALAIASQLGVPFSLILGIVFFGERIGRPRMIGLALAFTGIVIVVFDPAAVGELPGLALMALSSFVWAIGSLLQRRLSGVPVLTIYAWIGLVGTTVLFVLAWLIEPLQVRAIPDLRLHEFGWIAFSGIASTVIGQGGMAWLLQRHPIATVTPLTLASPVISVVAASYYFGSVLTPVMIAGGVLAMVGVAVITIRSARQGTA